MALTLEEKKEIVADVNQLANDSSSLVIADAYIRVIIRLATSN